MIVLDDPRHQRLRSIVSRVTPKVARIEAAGTGPSVGLIDANNPDRQGRSGQRTAGPLPLQIICDMMGSTSGPPAHFSLTNVILSALGDPDLATDFRPARRFQATSALRRCAGFEDRAGRPPDDSTSSPVVAEVDGERLSSREIASFFSSCWWWPATTTRADRLLALALSCWS